MEFMLLHLFLLALTTARTEGLISEDIMKTILESCYKNANSSNPTVIVGDFNKLIDGVSVLRISDFRKLEYYEKNQPLRFKAANVVLMENSPQMIVSNLRLLKETQLWDHMVSFFIVGRNTDSCENSKFLLSTMWRMEILNSIYICAKSIDNTSALYTLNPITNYAPHPWKKIEKLDDLNFYLQNFDANISCTHLAYDKTKILNGYTITAVGWGRPDQGWEIGRNYFDNMAESPFLSFKVLRALITAANATGRFEFEMGEVPMLERCMQGTADVTTYGYILAFVVSEPALFPHVKSEMIAVVKLKAEVSTLEKIHRLWSTPVLITAAVVLAILFLVLMIMNQNFGLALLDITRLLIYTGIRTNTRHQSFRIYFTTMLIFMVISNGVFQGKIAAFLTTSEKENTIKSISELTELEYQMYTLRGTSKFAGKNCHKCQFMEVAMHEECIQFVLDGTNNVCAIDKRNYEADFINLPLDYVEESFNAELEQFKCRRNWPLHNRMNNMMMQLVESGLIHHWDSQRSLLQRARRQTMEADWASAQYRPVRLPKLVFAFHLLAIGLSFSTIVFFLELLWSKLRDLQL